MLSKSTKLRIGCTAVALISTLQTVAAKGSQHRHHYAQGAGIWHSARGNTAVSPSATSWRYDEALSAPAGR
jgi:GH24 family phage-related lysozyme (muramidase)